MAKKGVFFTFVNAAGLMLTFFFVGLRLEIDYRSFLRTLDLLAGTEATHPF